MPQVRSFLTLSTAHVPEQFAQLLDKEHVVNWPVCGGPFDAYGWFMFADDENHNQTIPEEIMAVFAYARSLNCNYVLFDMDADVIPELPTWDW